jgi:argininosuccinate lyase
VVAAHVVMLRDAGILDESVAAALLTAMDGIGKGEPPAGVSLTMAIAAYDERLDALTAAGIVGAAAVGRGRADVAATVARLGLREHLLALGAAVDGARGALLDLGAEHVFTLMPAYAGGQAVQPTTLAHFLGGALGPLGRSAGRVRRAFDEVNRSPMGAVALASTGLPIDRERVAQLLGFDEALASTYDAVAAVDPLAEAVEAAAGVAATVRRFGTELLTWLRTEPESFRLGEGWAAAGEPGLPQFRPASGLEAMVVAARRTEGEAATVVGLLRDAPYGPAGVTLDAAIGPALATVEGAANLARRLAELVGGGLEVNRAYLANRAGRDHTTSSELADFLVAEEGLDPASARAIATMTVRKAMEQGIEASGITPELIDASALLVIGRELGVEIERIGRALAPRRFLERRGALGSPAPEATRAYLEAERDRLAADKRWRAEAEERIEARSRELERAMGEIVDAA